jgi:hypothetical protein
MRLFTGLTRFAGFTGFTGLSIMRRFDVGALRATPVQCRGTGLFTGLTRFARLSGLSIMRRFAVVASALNTGDTDARAGAPTVADHRAAGGFNKLKTKNMNMNHEIMVRTVKY